MKCAVQIIWCWSEPKTMSASAAVLCQTGTRFAKLWSFARLKHNHFAALKLLTHAVRQWFFSFLWWGARAHAGCKVAEVTYSRQVAIMLVTHRHYLNRTAWCTTYASRLLRLQRFATGWDTPQWPTINKNIVWGLVGFGWTVATSRKATLIQTGPLVFCLL